MNSTPPRGFIASLVKPLGWPLTLLLGAALAAAVGAAIGFGPKALAVNSATTPKQVASTAPAPKPKDAGLAAAYLAGRHAETNSEGDTAVEFYNRVIELDPENQSLLQNAYFLAAQTGDFKTALPAARRAYDAQPRRGMAPVLLAIEHFKKGEYDKALPYLAKTGGQTLNSFAMPVLRAWALAPTVPAETAISELDPLKTFQDTADLHAAMSGLLNEFYGRKDAAAAQYDMLAIKIGQGRFSTLRLTAEGYHRLGQDAKLKGLFDGFRATHGTSPTLDAYMATIPSQPVKKITPAQGMSEALFGAAELLLMNDPNDLRAQVATAYAQTALYLNPDLEIAQRFVGSTLAARGRYEDSNAVLGTLKTGSPGYLDVRMQIADNYMRMKRTDESVTVLQDLLKEKPEWTDAHAALGDMLRNDKKYDQAVNAYNNAIKFAPQGASAWAIYYSRGIAHERNKKWDEAEKDFRKALELRPNDPNVLNYLGYSYLDRGEKLKEARDLIESAYKQRPNDGYIIDSFGWALYMNGEFEAAVQNLEKAVESTPADGTINEHLGDAYWKVGRRNEARFQWERALLSADMEEPQRASLRTKLERGLAAK